MLLTNLELHGFKSFAKRTRMQFFPGITGIVGPNGCGKSNIVDAIRWVMGEQKGSVLRSERMEQVIFNGSQTRKPLSMSEVNITIDNNQGILPSEYNEITVTRRIYRDSESEYYLNHKKCRLKDIVDLFMDTGLGADSYGIIEPTLINNILSDNPGEKRILFEESAGIAKYKLRVKTAQRRLEEVNESLERLTDILSEVEKNVKSLKRQYNQAKAFEGLRSKAEEIETALLTLERAELMTKLAQLHQSQNSLQSRLNAKLVTRRELEYALSEIIASLNENENTLKNIRTTWEQYHSDTLNAQNRLLLLDEKERSALSESERGSEAIERAQQQTAFLQERMTAKKSLYEKQENEVKTLQSDVEKAEKQFSSLDSRLKELSSGVNEIETVVGALKASDSELEREITQRKIKISAFEERQQTLSQEVQNINAKLQELSEAKSQANTDKKRLQISSSEMESEISRREIYLVDLKRILEDKQGERLKLEISMERLKSEQQFLQSLLESGGGLPSGSAHLLKARPKGIVDSLSNILEVKPEYTTAIEAALSEAVHYVLVESLTEGVSALKSLRNENKGYASLIPLDLEMETHFFKSIMAPGVISTADRLVECAPRFSRLISALLSEVLVVENLEQAFKIKQDHQWQGLIVTLEGEALGKFTISGGKSPAKYPMVGRKRQMENILSEIKKYQQNIEILGEVIKDFHFQISREEKKLEKVKSQHKKLLDELQHLNTNIATLSAQGDAYSSRTREVETEQARIISEKSRLENELTQFQEKQRTLTVEISQTEEKLNEKQLQYREMNREAERKREDLHRKQLNLTSKNGELNNLKADISLSQSRLEELKVEITRYQNTIDAITSKLKEMKTERGRILIEVENYTRLHSQWQEKLYSSEAKQNEIKEQRQGIEGKLKKVALEEEELRREISELEVQSAELKSKISSKEDFALDKFGVDLTAIEPPLASQKSALELELSKLKKKLASIGPVNLLALQEYGKQKERFDFLQSEHQDIFKSKEELLETITKTNSEARARFNKVFEEVANYFKLLFTDLFDGGAGEISLAQGDPLEAEIILRANPAGKKLISLEQLSGGEKALTALALLFSLYQVKPSPFCILDEVDAPLDDANVDRFLKLLHRFAPKTQFILITHNKITMEACDYLYGATMEEDGVTKVVSVELQTSHKIAEAL